MNSTLYNLHTLCRNHFTTQACLIFPVLMSYLSQWRKLLSHFLSLSISLFHLPSLWLTVYLRPAPKPLSSTPSPCFTQWRWLHFLDLRSQRESIVLLRISFTLNFHTWLKVLNLIKKDSVILLCMKCFICPKIFMGLQCVLGAGVLNNSFSFVSTFLNVTL